MNTNLGAGKLAQGKQERPMKHASSLVFVGGEFPLTMFDERELFEGKIDPDQLKMGPIGQFSYSSGMYRFEVAPNRIDLKCVSSHIVVPNEIVDAAMTIVNMLEPVRRAIRISGFGMNCNTIIDQQSCGMGGVDFCSQLFQSQVFDLVGASSADIIDTSGQVRFVRDDVQYRVQIEPHLNSGGENLFVAVNGHQKVELTEQLDKKLNKVGAFRDYIESLHQRIINNPGGA